MSNTQLVLQFLMDRVDPHGRAPVCIATISSTTNIPMEEVRTALYELKRQLIIQNYSKSGDFEQGFDEIGYIHVRWDLRHGG